MIARGLAAALFTISVTPALAGVADSPLPELTARKRTLHLFTVPGILGSANLQTFFGCTSLEKSETVRIGVELFSDAGGGPLNDAAATALNVVSGGTVYFGTGATGGITIDSNLGASPGRGSARILTTSKKVACTAFVAERFNSPPTSMMSLTIIGKTTQKAAN
jgi:hypothetical protein